jgi:hypothetical protein
MMLEADAARLEELGRPPAASEFDALDAYKLNALEAERTFEFPRAMIGRFPSLALYDGDTVDNGGGGRPSGQPELYACLCSLAVMTSALRAFFGSLAEPGVAARATAMVTQAQARGPAPMFGVKAPARPLSEADLVGWGGAIRQRAPTVRRRLRGFLRFSGRSASQDVALAASFYTLVAHDLMKSCALVGPLRALPGLVGEALTGSWLECFAAPPEDAEGPPFDGTRWPEFGQQQRLLVHDYCRLPPAYQQLIASGFKTGFNLAQAVQGEAAPVAAEAIVAFLRQHGRAAHFFLDHYLLGTAGVLGASTLGAMGFKQGFVTSIVMDGHTYPVPPQPPLLPTGLRRA